MNVEVTNECNLHCNYCFNDSGVKGKYELSLNDWKGLIDTGQKYGAKSILITGGEFMKRNDSLEILNFSINKGLETSILSNGYKIGSIEKNILQGLQKAQISLDSYNPTIHDSQRGEGSWRIAINAINRLRNYGVPTEISSTLNSSNLTELNGLVRIAKETGSKLLLRPIQKIGRNESGDELSTKELKNAISSRKNISINDSFSYVPIAQNQDRDNLEKGIVTILPNGQVRGMSKSFREFLNVA